jgi:hypothetical protein
VTAPDPFFVVAASETDSIPRDARVPLPGSTTPPCASVPARSCRCPPSRWTGPATENDENDCLAQHTIIPCGDQAVDPPDRGSGPIRPISRSPSTSSPGRPGAGTLQT